MEIINRLESEVRSYCRSFPTVFTRAQGSEIFDRSGRAYLDFFAGAGALNYGHNHPALRDRLIDYLQQGGIAHGLDMATEAKCALFAAFEDRILRPRDLHYKLMFPGPTGTNAVEAALKLARKVTGRTHVVSFTNGFHGMTLGALAATGNTGKRAAGGVPLGHVLRAPFDGYFGSEVDTLVQLETLLADSSSGVEAPAAFLVETVQGEGGINVASARWLRGLAELARKHRALLIIDDIQVGCGRTGGFFSFEEAGIVPDIVCLSKSLSGFGLPLSLVLLRPGIDVWKPGEHNGTFRGNNLGFVTATAALDLFWADDHLTEEIQAKAAIVSSRLARLADQYGGIARGRGLIQGIAFDGTEIAKRASRHAFEHGLIVETAGAEDQVLKLLPPLTITCDELERGLDIIARSIAAAASTREHKRPAVIEHPRNGHSPIRANGHHFKEVVS
ncbi:MAG TPA: diaminobutyrate--2-oxoglutarate transaminase [Kofleriaceae bacterium]|nr:diaminobutyrate--2-oxoglutarate transaminase [Kofleriaceae bacterium]